MAYEVGALIDQYGGGMAGMIALRPGSDQGAGVRDHRSNLSEKARIEQSIQDIGAFVTVYDPELGSWLGSEF